MTGTGGGGGGGNFCAPTVIVISCAGAHAGVAAADGVLRAPARAACRIVHVIGHTIGHTQGHTTDHTQGHTTGYAIGVGREFRGMVVVAPCESVASNFAPCARRLSPP